METREKQIKRYKRNYWDDHIVEKPNRRRIIDNGDGTVEIEKAEGEILQNGSPITADRMNNIEEGILNNNILLISNAEDIKTLDLRTMVLQAALFGGVVGEMVMIDLDDPEALEIDRGVYDEKNKIIYCVDNEGNKFELEGFGVALA